MHKNKKDPGRLKPGLSGTPCQSPARTGDHFNPRWVSRQPVAQMPQTETATSTGTLRSFLARALEQRRGCLFRCSYADRGRSDDLFLRLLSP
jgi:hypothetical protein